jgi:ribosomal protein S30
MAEDTEPMNGLILDYPAEFFSSKTEEQAIEAGFTPAQLPYIRGELKKLNRDFKPSRSQAPRKERIKRARKKVEKAQEEIAAPAPHVAMEAPVEMAED